MGSTIDNNNDTNAPDCFQIPAILINGAASGQDRANMTAGFGNAYDESLPISDLLPRRKLSSTCHASLLIDVEPKSFEKWMRGRRKRTLSVPDLRRLYNEWSLYQTSGLEDIQPCQLQVDLLNIRTDTPLKWPAMRVKMGAIKYRSSRSNIPTGDWNEGFVFVVSYHAQLFNTIEFDLYDVPRKHWPKRIHHVGKAKLKISRLEGREDVFTTYLPIYEYSSSRRRLPPDTTELIERRSDMFKKAMDTFFKKAKLIGSVQIRIRYKFQDPADAAAKVVDQWKHTLDMDQLSRTERTLANTPPQQQRDRFNSNMTLNTIHPLDNSSHPSSSIHPTSDPTTPNHTNGSSDTLGSSRLAPDRSDSTRKPSHQTISSSTTANTDSNTGDRMKFHQKNRRTSSLTSIASGTFKTNDNNSRSQHGRGDLARDETFINGLFKNQLEKVMTADIPRRYQGPSLKTTGIHTKTATNLPTSEPSSPTLQHHPHGHQRWRPGFITKRKDQQSRRRRRLRTYRNRNNNNAHCMSFDWLTALLHPNKDDHSARGRRYGFQQNDTDYSDEDVKRKATPSPTSKSNNRQSNTTLSTTMTADGGKDDNDDAGPSSVPVFRSPTQLDFQPGQEASMLPGTNNKKERGRAYRLTHKAKKKAKHIISSVEFGDKSFGSRWMQDSFEVVALSHPVADHLIGLAVKTQTQALVRAIIVLANSFGQGFKVTAIQLVKAMLLLERFYRSLPKQVTLNEIKDRYIIDVGNHYFRYALVAYGWRGLAYLGLYGQLIRRSGGKSRSNRLAILNYLRVESGDLLGYEYGLREGAAFQPSYFVAVDRPKRNIVLSIRGTWSLYDAITDLVCYYVPWKGGLVHSGMLASAQWIFIHIVPQIFRYIHLHRNFLKGFVITGHSLGGGAASLLTMMVADELETLQKLADNPEFQLRCYSYAPVALVSYELACKYDQYIHSFIVQDDIVGRLSYGTALKLKDLILDTISVYEALGGMAKVVTNSKSRKLCYDLIDKCRALIFKSTTEAPPVLYIPGKIIHIRRRRVKRFGGGSNNNGSSNHSEQTAHMSKHIPGASRPVYSVHLGNRQICEEMIVTKTAILDHTIGAYQEAFDKLSAMYPASLYPTSYMG